MIEQIAYVGAGFRNAEQPGLLINHAVELLCGHLLGTREVWRSDLAKAKTLAAEASIQVGNGEQSSLDFPDRDRLARIRAIETPSPALVPIDTACREYVDALQILGNVGLWDFVMGIQVNYSCRGFTELIQGFCSQATAGTGQFR
jgi:hypothetical protein